MAKAYEVGNRVTVDGKCGTITNTDLGIFWSYYVSFDGKEDNYVGNGDWYGHDKISLVEDNLKMKKFDINGIFRDIVKYETKDKRYTRIWAGLFLLMFTPFLYGIISILIENRAGTEDSFEVLCIMAIFLPISISGFLALVINDKWINKIEHIDFIQFLIFNNEYRNFLNLSIELKISYLGYDTLEEDIVIVYYKFDGTDKLIELEYNYYDSFNGTSNEVSWEDKYNWLNDENIMHKKHIRKIYIEEQNNAVAKKEARFQEKIKSLWK